MILTILLQVIYVFVVQLNIILEIFSKRVVLFSVCVQVNVNAVLVIRVTRVMRPVTRVSTGRAAGKDALV